MKEHKARQNQVKTFVLIKYIHRYGHSTQKGWPHREGTWSQGFRKAYNPIECVCRHANSTPKGDSIAKALNLAELRNPKAL